MNDPKIPRLDTDNEYQQTIPDEAEDAKIRAKWDAFPYKIMQSDGEGNWHELKDIAQMPTAYMNPETAAVVLELVQQLISTLLYFAKAAQQKNIAAAKEMPYAELPTAWQAEYVNSAASAVSGLDIERRQAAGRAALIHAERWLKAHIVYAPKDAPSAGDLVAALTMPTTANIVTEVLAAYQEALCRK